MRTRKKESEEPAMPQWKKRRGSFTYESVDPIAGGLWVYRATRKMTDEELNQRVYSVAVTGCGVRPKRGQIAELHPHGDD